MADDPDQTSPKGYRTQLTPPPRAYARPLRCSASSSSTRVRSREQITQHFCIQGWSGIAKWGGVSMQTIVVAECSEIGGGYGGYNQDHEFFGYRQSI